MAMKYSKEFKDSVIVKLLSPSNISVLDVAKETGIPKDTLRMVFFFGGGICAFPSGCITA